MNYSFKARRLGWAVLGALLVGLAHQAAAQVGTSSILGYVYDSTGAAIPRAQVTLTRPSTGLRLTTKTNQTGLYKFPDLLPGTYDLTITHSGFQTYQVRGIVLQVDQHPQYNATLQVGAVTQAVTVRGGVQMLETNTASAGQVIPERTVVSLPLNGRNFLQLATLGAGTTPPVLQGSNASFATNITGTPNSTVNLGGNRESATSYLLDGIPARDERTGALVFQISVDSIQEFKEMRNFFPAEYGFHPAIVNVSTKSGTNEIHGDAWEFLRNDSLDARNFFSPSIEPFHQNQFGATLGGPVRKDKLFFFGDYEGFRERLSAIQTGVYPDIKQFSGDLSAPGVFGDQPIYNPLTFNPVTGTKQPFPGNIIPASMINPYALKAIQRIFPPNVTISPNGITPNVVVTPPSGDTYNQFIVRMDGQDVNTFGKQTQMFGRFSYINGDVFSNNLAPLTTLNRFDHDRNAVYQATTSFSPTTVNVFRMGYQREFTPFVWAGSGGSDNISKDLGLNNTTTNPRDFAAPNFSLVGFSGTGGGFNLQTVSNHYIFADDVTKIIGGHTVMWGAEVRHTNLLEETSTFANGELSFSGQFTAQTQFNPTTGQIENIPGTGSSIADFLLGNPYSGIAAYGNTLGHWEWYEFGLFLQDDWKVKPGLTLQYGLRYEPSTAPTDNDRNVYIFDFQNGTLLFPKLGQVPPSLVNLKEGQLAPRVGLAWSPGFDKNSVFRAGFGTYFDETQLNELQFENFGSPFFNLQSFTVPQTTAIDPFTLGVNTFPSIVPPPIAPGFKPAPGAGPFSIDNSYANTPTVYQWTVDYQRLFGMNWLFDLGYAGLRGNFLSRRYDFDQCSISVPNSLFCDPTKRPYPNLSQLFLSTQGAFSDYNALDASLQHKFSNSFSLLIGYTWGKSLDTDSGGSWATPTARSNCLRCDYGPSDFNISQRLSGSAVWQIPVGRGRRFLSNMSRPADLLVGGWTFSAITDFQTGPWGNIFAPNVTADSGISVHRGNCLGGDNYAPGSLRTNGMQFLNPANFSIPAVGYFGTCGRGVFQGPGLNNWDTALLKDVKLGERFTGEFRAEFFNAFNHAQFDLPVSSLSSPLFGKVESAERPREIQFGLKLYF
jgi:hypothetical protein